MRNNWEVKKTPELIAKVVAREIANLIKENNRKEKHTVLGLATGSTPIPIYRELVRLHREEGLDFSNVVTFNLDEYVGLLPSNPNSYRYFMNQHLFNHVNIKPENIHMLDGTIEDEKEAEEAFQIYEEKIKRYGGIDLQILGIGRDGHIGFNEPGADRNKRTHREKLNPITRKDNARFFNSMDDVPHYADTMGIATILEAKQIYLIATGAHKASIMEKAIMGPVCKEVPASYLQEHPKCRAFMDTGAAKKFVHNWLSDRLFSTSVLSELREPSSTHSYDEISKTNSL